MNVLVLASTPISGDELLSMLGEPSDPSEIEVMVVAPAVHESPVKFWLSDADDAIERADRVRAETLKNLSDADIPASADTGESDPMEAISDALRTFEADQIVLVKRPDPDQGFREDVTAAAVHSVFGIPVQEAVLSYQ